ncbi:MAG: hypothetical protein ACJ8KX_00595 [Chthoniobacterales bacterium]
MEPARGFASTAERMSRAIGIAEDNKRNPMADQQEDEPAKQHKDLEAEEDPKGGGLIVTDKAGSTNQNTTQDGGGQKDGLIVTD